MDLWWTMSNEIRFSTMRADGTEIDIRMIKQSDIAACPWSILVPSHYRDDGSCRCDDPTHTEMLEWGYVWGGDTDDDGNPIHRQPWKWVAGDDDEST